MIVKRITLKGIRSFKDLVTVDIPLGITGIIGVHDTNPERSNGIGKTTLATSMLYTYYGDTSNIKTLNDIECDQLLEEDDKFAEIEFYQAETNNTYTVKRGRQNGSSYFELYEDKKPLGGTSIASRELELKRILGMDYDMFTATTFFEQNQLNKIVSADSKDRRNYIDKVLGLVTWRDSSSAITTDSNKVKKEIEELKESIKTLLAESVSSTTKLKELPQVEITLQSNIEVKQKLETSITDKKSLIQQQEVYLLKQSSIVSKKKEKVELATQLSFIDKEINLLIADQKIKERDSVELPEKKSVADSELTNLTKELDKLSNQVKSLEDIIQHRSLTRTKLETTLHHINTSIKDLNNSTCDKCEQDITEAYKELKIAEKNKELLTTQQSIDALNNTRGQAVTELQQVTTNMKSVTANIEKLKQQSTSYTIEISKLDISIKSIQKQLSDKQLQQQQKKQSIDKITKDIDKLDKELEGSDFTSVEQVQKEIVELNTKLEHTNTAITNLQQQIGGLLVIKDQLDNVKKEIEEKENILKSKELDLYIYTIVDKAFKDIPTQIFEETIAYTNREASSIVQRIYPNMEVELYEDKAKKYKPLEVKVEVSKKSRNFVALSEGQKTIVSLALRLGLAKAISARSNRKIDMIILDEPFGMLDAHSQTQVQSILADLLLEFKQILVITHIGNINNYPNLITVRMSDTDSSYIA